MSEENIKRYSLEDIDRMIANGESMTDWARVRAMTDEDIEAAIKDDPDWEGWDDVDWSKGVWVNPGVGRTVSLKLDEDVIAAFEKQGPDLEARINHALRCYLDTISKAAE